MLHDDAYRLYHELVAGDGLPALIVSVIAGLATFALVVRERFEPARYTAALAVAAIVAGLGAGPVAASSCPASRSSRPPRSHDVLVTIIVAVVGGAIILFPSLVLLFRLTLGGQLGHGSRGARRGAGSRARARARRRARPARPYRRRVPVAGFGLLTVAEAGWAHAVGVVALFAFIVVGFAGAVPALLEDEPAGG